MITIHNIVSEYPKIDQSILPKQLQAEEFEFVAENIDLYNDDETIKEFMDKFVELVNKAVMNAASEKPSQKAKPKPKAKKEPKPKSEAKPKAPKKKAATVKTAETQKSFVDNAILPSVAIIKRFVALHKKEVSIAACEQLLKSLQRSIIARKIKKNDDFAKQIQEIQTILVKVVNGNNENVSIPNIELYKEIVDLYSNVNPLITIAKAFVKIEGKSGVKDEAKKLLERMAETNQSDNTHTALIRNSLNNYISGKTDIVEVNAIDLRGIYGLAGAEHHPTGNVISAKDLILMKFDTIKLSPKFAQFIGKPSENFKMMVSGLPGSGKSSLMLQLVKELSKKFKILIIAKEERKSETLQNKLIRFNIGTNVFVSEGMPKSFDGYDVILIDSVNALGLKPECLQKLYNLKKIVLLVFQSTKTGLFKGDSEFEHDVDISIEVKDGIATQRKNRFGGSGIYKVF